MGTVVAPLFGVGPWPVPPEDGTEEEGPIFPPFAIAFELFMALLLLLLSEVLVLFVLGKVADVVD